MEYADNFYRGYPALTVHPYGSGLACYVCADAEADFYQDLYRNLIADRQIRPILDDIPEGIEVSSRSDTSHEYVFVQNYTDGAVSIRLPDDGRILSGSYDGTIPGYSTNKTYDFIQLQALHKNVQCLLFCLFSCFFVQFILKFLILVIPEGNTALIKLRQGSSKPAVQVLYDFVCIHAAPPVFFLQ